MDDATLATLRNAAGASFDAGFAGMVGALATLALLRDTSSDWAAHGARRVRRLFMRSTLLALAASLAWMAVQSVLLTELGPLAGLPAVIQTAFGQAWAVAVLGLVACAALAHARRFRPMPLRGLGLAVTVVAIAHADGGHAGANGLGWLLPTMTVHALATGLWAGAVFAAALAVWRGAPHEIDGPRCARRLSRVATAALLAVVVTGAATAWHELGGTLAPLRPADGPAWSRLLDAKLTLVGLAAALGAFNRFVVMPSLPETSTRFARVLRLEAVVLLAVVATAAWLANGDPPAM